MSRSETVSSLQMPRRLRPLTQPFKIAKTGIFSILILVVALGVIWRPLKEFMTGGHADFEIRYNELQCIKTGTNPFDVWNGTVKSTDFYRLNSTPPNISAKYVHAYTPWSYTYFWPLSFFSLNGAYRIFVCLELICFSAVLVFCFKVGMQMSNHFADGVFAVAAFCLSGHGYSDAWSSGNYSWTVLFSLLAMSFCLNRGRDILAGFFLAIAMSKPQMAALFVIPLLFSGKMLTLIVGAVICIAASVFPATLLNCSPLVLVVEIPKIGSEFVSQTLLVPRFLFSRIDASIGRGAGVAASAALGILLCCAFSRRTLSFSDWKQKMLPSVLLSCAWTYCMGQDTVVYGWANLALFTIFARDPSPCCKMVALAACCLLTSSYLLNLSPNYTLGKLFFTPPTTMPAHLGTVHQTLAEIVRWLQRGGTILALYLLWTRSGTRTKQMKQD